MAGQGIDRLVRTYKVQRASMPVIASACGAWRPRAALESRPTMRQVLRRNEGSGKDGELHSFEQ
jgi:hypothetical protein